MPQFRGMFSVAFFNDVRDACDDLGIDEKQFSDSFSIVTNFLRQLDPLHLSMQIELVIKTSGDLAVNFDKVIPGHKLVEGDLASELYHSFLSIVTQLKHFSAIGKNQLVFSDKLVAAINCYQEAIAQFNGTQLKTVSIPRDITGENFFSTYTSSSLPLEQRAQVADAALKGIFAYYQAPTIRQLVPEDLPDLKSFPQAPIARFVDLFLTIFAQRTPRCDVKASTSLAKPVSAAPGAGGTKKSLKS